ncbi:MAG: integration host factor subunit alpha [Pseudomonadota bacterium]
MTLTKERLIESIYNQCGFSKKKSVELIESFIDLMKSSLASGEDVLVSGFGKFHVRDKKDRRGRNPQTGEDLILGERRVVTFKCSSVLREKLNGKD